MEKVPTDYGPVELSVPCRPSSSFFAELCDWSDRQVPSTGISTLAWILECQRLLFIQAFVLDP